MYDYLIKEGEKDPEVLNDCCWALSKHIGVDRASPLLFENLIPRLTMIIHSNINRMVVLKPCLQILSSVAIPEEGVDLLLS